MAPSATQASSSILDTDMGDTNYTEEPVNEEGEPLTMLRLMPEAPPRSDVCVVGAGPTGVMLASLLTRFGVKVEIIDERADKTTVGRADGLQPKTVETLRMLRMGDELIRTGAKCFDISMWRAGTSSGEPVRLGRYVHYPAAIVDILHPYLLLCHQGMVEGIFLDDLRRRGVEVRRSHQFESYSMPADDDRGPLKVNCKFNVTQDDKTIYSDYLVGCDGARSKVRKSIPGTFALGTPHDSVWGVLDGEIETDFPDIWSKTVVFSEDKGSVMIVPRERNMTRLYIEMRSTQTSHGLGQQYVMERARLILAPYSIKWRSIEWFGRYQVAQRVAARFADPHQRAFIAGDASHTHTPKASQGMNTSMHDAWNLGWKLNLAVRGLAKQVLLESYEEERKKIAHDLIDFDYEHANQIAGGDADALAENFRVNVRFISGVGVEYSENVLNQGLEYAFGEAKPGCNIPPAKVTRYIDANPVDMQLDIPVLGQFKIYVFVPDIMDANGAAFLQSLSDSVAADSSAIVQLSGAAYRSYLQKPRLPGPEDLFIRPERYTRISHLFTFALITATDKKEFELSSLPLVFAESRWTVYLDDVPYLDTRGQHCTEKWLGTLTPGEVAIVNVRPDGYIGSVRRWDTASAAAGVDAAHWLENYYSGFLQVPAPMVKTEPNGNLSEIPE